jgi:sugar/nucleoside kinase (ribokinase family)
LNSSIDYLLVGHASHDVTPAGRVPGGTVIYAGRMAALLGCRTAVVSSAAGDYDWSRALPGIPVVSIAAAQTTIFANHESANGRLQYLYGLAERLTAEHVPAAWQRPAIVHLAPIANEVDPALTALFRDSLVALTPQGWHRTWDSQGRVSAVAWPAARETLSQAAAVILSRDDLPDAATLEQYRLWTRLLVVTEGAKGCTVYHQDESRHFTAPPVKTVESTGAGDIFAASFLVRLIEAGGNPWPAAEFATNMAACSVGQPDLDSKMAALEAAVASYSPASSAINCVQ